MKWEAPVCEQLAAMALDAFNFHGFAGTVDYSLAFDRVRGPAAGNGSLELAWFKPWLHQRLA